MAIKISDLVITTDIDGTLLNAPSPIPPRNLEAIHRYTEKGGRFAIASGRSIESARQYVNLLPINAPCIVFNGSGVYDYTTETLLCANYLPETYRLYVKALIAKFPHIGAVLLNRKEMHSVSAMRYTREYLGAENQPFLQGDADETRGDFFKMILSMPEELIPQVEAFALAQDWQDVTFVRSSPNFLEMLPLGCHKGSGLLQLVKVMGISMEQVVSIGDYYNDLEMLKTTAFPVTVADAPEDIKRICKLVTGPCDHGALADLIEYLERKELEN